jgi:3-oxoacyl-[acyl-carrier protein] reductase
MTKTLLGKVALVTGGSRGIGAAIARRLASDGAAVALTYSASPDKAMEVVASIVTAGGKAIAIKADAADVAAVKAAVAETVAVLGGLDVLVNNAGVATVAMFEEVAIEDYDRMFAVNVKGVFVATQEAVRHMKDGGRVVNIGSINSEFVPTTALVVYTATKGAVASMTRALARDLGPRGITVNNIQPGPVDTDMNPDTGAFADIVRGLTSIKRYGHADEIAGLVSYLASPEAAFVTGASLRIDGGMSA